MTDKPKMPPSVLIADEPQVEPTELVPGKPGRISGMASAAAPFIYIDNVSFWSHQDGVGMVTLTAARFISMQPNNTSPMDHVVVAHLRGSLVALARLRNAIDDILLKAAAQAEMAAGGGHTAH